jgi:DNA polymerase-3 subunit alpha
MSADMDNTDRLVVIKDDCRQMGLELMPPDVNKSAYHFSIAGKESILYGLGAIKSVGRSAVESIIAERDRRGPFTSLSEFCRRIDHDKVNRRTVEAMIKAGALDGCGANRRSLMHQLPVAMKAAEQQARAAEAGQNDMFGMARVVEPLPETRVEELLEWNEGVLLSNEKEALGLYLTGHPFDAVRHDARFFVDATFADIAAEQEPVAMNGERNYMQGRRDMTVAGLITDVRKRGNRFTVVLDDDSGRLEVSLFAETYQEFRDLLVKDEIVVVDGTLAYDDFIGGWRMSARNVQSIDRVIEARAQSMVISLRPNGNGEALLHKLHDVLMPFRRGRCTVSIQYTGSEAAGRLHLGPEWSVRPSRELRDRLGELLGRDSVRLLYAPNAK